MLAKAYREIIPNKALPRKKPTLFHSNYQNEPKIDETEIPDTLKVELYINPTLRESEPF